MNLDVWKPDGNRRRSYKIYLRNQHNYNKQYLVSALLLGQHDLAEGSLAQHLDEVEVIQRHLPAPARAPHRPGVIACRHNSLLSLTYCYLIIIYDYVEC